MIARTSKSTNPCSLKLFKVKVRLIGAIRKCVFKLYQLFFINIRLGLKCLTLSHSTESTEYSFMISTP